jgi:hypothetical protein
VEATIKKKLLIQTVMGVSADLCTVLRCTWDSSIYAVTRKASRSCSDWTCSENSEGKTERIFKG